MKATRRTGLVWLRVAALAGGLFGLMTIRQGGAVLFGDDAARAAAGNFVPFVLWFNFLAGFAYVTAGIGLWIRRIGAVYLAFGISLATLIVFAGFGWYALTGGAYETRTVAAMTLRSTVWLVIALTGWRILRPSSSSDDRARAG